MKEGFYRYKSNIYYGLYDETQVSSQKSLQDVSAKRVKTDHEITEEDFAVIFHDNHMLMEPEEKDFEKTLEILKPVSDLNTEEMDFSSVEDKLGREIPKELRLAYAFMGNSTIFFQGEEHFLPLDELYMDCGQLVFYHKKKKPEAAYDFGTGCLTRFYRKEWELDPSDFSVYQFFQNRMINCILQNKPVAKQAKLRGKFFSSINIQKDLVEMEDEEYKVLRQLNLYGIAVMYSKEGLLAWFRSNGLYADVHVGAKEESEVLAFGRFLGDIKWKILKSK